MNYMVVEKFHPGKIREIYERLEAQGRLMPEGVRYVNSWIDEDLSVCFQLMQSESRALLQQWIDRWSDLFTIEVYPVISSAETKKRVLHS